jgi:hypothetical protein
MLGLWFWGQFNPGWWWGPAAVAYYREVCGLDLGDQLDASARAYAGTVESACWWFPHRDFVMVSERPLYIHRDARGRLHSDTGAAIAWPDGFGLYMVHGVRMPDDVMIDASALTVERIDAEGNAEVRRILVDRFGRERYMREGGATLLDDDKDQFGRPLRLWHRSWKDRREMLFVEATNSTPEPDGTFKTYVLGVHPECRPLLGEGRLGEPQKRTARNAIASLVGKRGEDYRPSIET